jgi:hypothetical protein
MACLAHCFQSSYSASFSATRLRSLPSTVAPLHVAGTSDLQAELSQVFREGLQLRALDVCERTDLERRNPNAN